MTVTYAYESQLVVIECCNCHMDFGMPDGIYRARREDHDWFYCPAGHVQHFTGKSEEAKLRAEVARLEGELVVTRNNRDHHMQEAEHQRRSAAAIKGHLTRLRKRALSGTCPCCKRSFEQVRDHMQTKHPDEYARIFGDG